MIEIIEEQRDQQQHAVIKVIGVGGGGGNAVFHMAESKIEGVELLCANTDAQALRKCDIARVLQLGATITKGLGAGAKPEVGRDSALADRALIEELIHGADMLFITAGMGGGTGTGAAPVVAQIAKEMGILTVAVVTRPFGFEGKQRMRVAEEGIKELASCVDSLITIPNDKLLPVLGRNVSLRDAFKEANNVLYSAVQGISDLIIRPGLINVDFADVCTVMSCMGIAMMGTGVARGEGRAREAAAKAIASPLLDDVSLSNARGILVNIIGGTDVSIGEFEEVGNIIHELAAEDARVIVGTSLDLNKQDELRVTVVATGLGTAPTAPVRTSSKNTRSETARPHVVVNPPQPTATSLPKNPPSGAENEFEYLDIPAFLRRQAE